MNRWELWLKGMLAAGIAGAANGVMTGFAAVGIDPSHFNLQSGFHNTMAIAGVSAGMSSIIAVAAYLKQSPLPGESDPVLGRDDHHDHDDHHPNDDHRNDHRV
jgi:hypothetical protein